MPQPWRIRVRRTTGPDCNHLSDQPCPACEQDKSKPIGFPAAHEFKETVYEHLFSPGERPFAIGSRRQLAEESARRGVRSQALQESMHHSADPPKWF